MYCPRTRILREEFEYMQKYVAKYLDCNRSTYANWEIGNIILPLDIANKLAILYNVSLSYILGLNTIKKEKSDIRMIDYIYMRSKLNELKIINNNSFEEISKYIDTNRSTTNRYFNVKISMPTDKLILLCEFYNIEIDELCEIK